MPTLRVPSTTNAEEEQKKLAELWMVPYADLTSILVIFFLGFYAYSQLREKDPKYEKMLTVMQKDLAADEKEVDRLVVMQKEGEAAAHIKEYLVAGDVVLGSKRIRITFAAPILFKSGAVELKAGAAQALDPVVEALSQIDNPVVVEGHTDDRPVGKTAFYDSNFELATLRAFSVIEYFASKGLDPRRFSAYGYGEHHPVTTNATAEGRATNRRIEVYVVREK